MTENQSYDDVPNPSVIENQSVTDKAELEELKSKYLGTPGMNSNKIPEHQQWITHKSISDTDQLNLLRSWDKSRKTGDNSEFENSYSSLQKDKLLEFGGLAGEAALNASTLIGGVGLVRGAYSVAKTGLSAAKGLFTSKAEKAIAEKAIAEKAISKTAAAEETAASKEAFKAKTASEIAKVRTRNARGQFQKEEAETFKPKVEAIKKQQAEAAAAKSEVPTKSPFKSTISKAKSIGGKLWEGVKTFGSNVYGAIKKAGIFGAGVGAGLLGAGGNGGGGSSSSVGAAGGLHPIVNSIDPILSSAPSGGDMGTTGESHFGGESLAGKSVAEILTKIYELTVKHGDYLRIIASNTGQLTKQAVKADATQDLMTANQLARSGEHQGTQASYSVANRVEEAVEDIEEDPKFNNPGKSSGKPGMVTKYLKKAMVETLKWGGLIGLASYFDDAEANIGDGGEYGGYMGSQDGRGGSSKPSWSKAPEGSSAENMPPIDNGSFANIRQQIKKYESAGGNYNILVGGKTKENLSQMTFGEVKKYQQEHMGRKHGLASDAVGAYQFIGSTLEETQKAAGLSDTDVFSPENQDKLANILIQQAYKDSGGDLKKFVSLLSARWAAFGDPLRPGGKNQYDKGGVNKTLVSAEKVMQAAQKDIDILNDPDKKALENVLAPVSEKLSSNINPQNQELAQLQKKSAYSSDRFVPISSGGFGEDKILDTQTNKIYDKGLAPTATAVDIQHNALALTEKAISEDVPITETPKTNESSKAFKDFSDNLGTMMMSFQQQAPQQQPTPTVKDTPLAGTGTSRVPYAINNDPTLISMIRGNLMTA